ncbi:cytochrome P450 [Kitasatospora sp. NE20-6]|uniref:cytochrome P450 n=1 Tax=Kitasatospora sp. NE20-6 TaxID=2859066 RepID=UPI0034DBFA07
MSTVFTIAEASGSFPLAGHALRWLRNPQEFVRGLVAQGDLVRVRVGPIQALVVCHPELVQRMLLDDRVFDKGGALFDRVREFAGNGLVTCPHQDHRRQRRVLQPAFQRSRMPDYAAMMTDQIGQVVGRWQHGEDVDAARAMHEITSRVARATIFAAPADESVHQDFCDALRTVFRGMYRRMLTPALLDRIPTPGKVRYDRARARLREIAGLYLAESRAGGADRRDVLSLLLASREDDPRPVAEVDEEIFDQVVNLLVASVETTASLLSSVLYLLTLHPDVEYKLHQEVDEVLGGREATWEDLAKLDYTGRVITEALRRYSTVWLLTRTVTEDTELGGHPVAAGTMLIYSTLALHGRPDLYHDPDRFDPDRWPAAGEGLPRGAFVPFAAGARKCIGDVFAVTEATLVLATIASRWQLRPAPGERIRWARGVTVTPNGLRMTVRERFPEDRR